MSLPESEFDMSIVLVRVEISPTHYTASFDDFLSLYFLPSLPAILILSLRHQPMDHLPQGCDKYGPGRVYHDVFLSAWPHYYVTNLNPNGL